MSIVKKVNIDELVHVLLEMRQKTEFVDLEIINEDTLRILTIEKESKASPKKDDNFNDINLAG